MTTLYVVVGLVSESSRGIVLSVCYGYLCSNGEMRLGRNISNTGTQKEYHLSPPPFLYGAINHP